MASTHRLAAIFFSLLCLLVIQQSSGYHDKEDHEGANPMLEGEFIRDMCEEPPPPMNGEITCGNHKKKQNKFVCKAECPAGFQFPNGKGKARHMCDLASGKWSPTFAFSDCQPICNPPCENSGQCSDGTHCICTPQHRGDRCQYDLALCDPEKGLQAAAQWSCNHTSTETVCTFSCPQGTRYGSQPADSYECSIDGTWTPNFAPKCIPINIIEPPSSYGLYPVSNGQSINSKIPNSGVCATWGGYHYRTFDGGIFSFEGSCSYLLSKDCESNTFAIHLRNGKACDTVSACETQLSIYIGSERYTLSNGEEAPVVRNGENSYFVPVTLNGLMFQMLSDYVLVRSSLGFRLKWNRKSTILFKVTHQLNTTCGLCGRFDGSVLNDFGTSDGGITDSVEGFVNSWAMDELGEKCEHKAVVKDHCSEKKERIEEAEEKCRVIYDDRFSTCHHLVDPQAYFEACRMDHCGCTFVQDRCYCGSLSEYFRECVRLGGKIESGWRRENLCPLSCPGGMIYKDCGTSCPKTCKRTVYDCEDDYCVDGCHCPDGSVLHNGVCVEKNSCPCLHNDKEYEPGEKLLQDCNACECIAGSWECTKQKCEARCSSTGDPHYTTFDGLNYEFLGSCPYYLVHHDDFTIVQESGPCPTLSVSEPATESMFCTKSLKIEYKSASLLLEPGIKATFNEKGTELPLSEEGFIVSMATDLFLMVSLENGVSVLWDGQNRVYIDAPPSLYGQTMGLCGTFNHNQNDDFLTPERDLEADVSIFASRWQASDSCHKRERRSSRQLPCESQPQKLEDAEMLCSVITQTDLFKACHGELDPQPFYKRCVNDLCLCGEKLEACLCPVLADYSLSCSRKGIPLNWVDEIPACKPDCTGSQVYQECGNSCTSTCAALATEEGCKVQCVQGCRCVDGMAMNNEGFCISMDQCPCTYEGKDYPPSAVTLQGSNVCNCQSGKWQCRPGSLEEMMSLNPDLMLGDQPAQFEECLIENNEEFTKCREECPRTCQNVHLPPKCKTKTCRPGCRCKDGFILDAALNKCVEMSHCGCIHADKRFSEGDQIKQACNLCTCSEGSWKCTEKVCHGICTSWGDSHFKTFDGKIYDFQGGCEYILSKGKMKGASFLLSLQNVPCGSSGITCSKSFTLTIGSSAKVKGGEATGEEEKLTLSIDEPLPKVSRGSRFVVLESGLFVLVYTDIGISLQWDRGTRIYVTADPKWRNRVKGLCGNFNDDQGDDFLTPFGGIPEAKASVFGHSWRIHEFCADPETIEDTCAIHPQRKSWAQQKCGILNEDIFASCHSEVSPEPFYDRCIFDSCACDMGGDCDCLCTAIAAYGRECSIHGVPVRWRSQQLCPIQCEECSVYDTCMPSCPKKTCENGLIYHKIEQACSDDFCVEGCNPKSCPEGQIFNNSRDYKCIPEVDCVVPCLQLNGRLYNEGERITDREAVDACQSCHCRSGAISCTGMPCVRDEPIRPCVQGGWTPWMNSPSVMGGDYERLADPLLKAAYKNYCDVANMTGIECRVAQSKVPYTEAKQEVVCQLPLGLTCEDDKQKNSFCEDYEIRTFCDCGPSPTTTTTAPTTIQFHRVEAVCEQTGWTAWMSGHWPNAEGEAETIDTLRQNHYFCAEEEIENIECRTTLSWEYVSGEDENVLCNKKVGLVCKGPSCADYEVRFFCNCGVKVTTSAVPSCVTGWTEYFNTDHPETSETGDDESIDRIRQLHPFCQGGTLEDIECKTLVNGDLVDYSLLDTFGLKCSKNVGFICNKYVRTEKCPNFMVRFYCACEITVVETTLPVMTTPSPSPVTPVPIECGWTPWLNMDVPEGTENDTGDIESLAEIQLLYQTCGGKDLIDIECRMSRTLHSYSYSLQNGLVCDTQKGFICHNSEQIGKCYDYEIRLLCMYEWCYPPTTTEITTTTQNPCPHGQVYDKCAYRCDQLCSSFLQELTICSEIPDGCVEGCRPTHGCERPNVWRDHFSCVRKEECTCILIEGEEMTVVGPNEVVIRECEKCQCVHNDLSCFSIPDCGVLVDRPRTLLRENITRSDCWTEWINLDQPSSGGGDLEILHKIRKHFEFCADPVKIECRTSKSKQAPYEVGQVVACDLETGLICWNTDNQPDECYDYETRFFCPCPTSRAPTTTTPVPTREPSACEYGWTEWYNGHIPDGRGDYESVQSARITHSFCDNDMISAIECRRVGSSNTRLHQHGVQCDLLTGLLCIQEYLGEYEACWDYEVRFFCDCPTMAPLTETATFSTALPPHLPCSYWSDWINENHPSGASANKKGIKGGGGNRGDSEKVMLLKLQREYQFCLEGYLSDIECREDETDVDYSESGDTKLVCSLAGGFRCRARDQPNRLCKDYKIRYFCSCREMTTTPVLTRPTVPEIHIEPCNSYYYVVDGPYPLPDSSLKVSSSKNSESGPQSARLSSTSTFKSAGAWIAGETSDNQFIEVDLGRIQPIYGVVTKGRNAYEEWVKSYKVLFSRDGVAYAYVTDDSWSNNDRVLSGNYDSDSAVEHIFIRPVEGRYVRLQPVTYHKEIALRMDVLGCADGMSTVAVSTTTAPPCIDEMGLYNGLISDHQIKTSGDRNPNSDGRYVRLNTPQSEYHSGGWVSEDVDENQYVQIDFVDSRILTGIKIQGRDKVPQWVTAFTVSYSQDGSSWNEIMDKYGVKVFPGNYDSSTVVVTYFPQPVRARYIRIHPVGWENWIAMRFEILGCYEPLEEVKDEIGTTPKPVILEGKCTDPMGFENHQLPDSLISVSSSSGPESGVSRIRLNTHSEEGGTGGWVAAIDDYQPVVLIDFYEERNLTGIITQGLEDNDMWVISYNVLYSLDNVTWENVIDLETGNMVFSGNFDRNTEVLRLFSTTIQTRYIKIVILDYHTGPALRMEIWGCFIPYAVITAPPPVLNTVTEFCVEYGPWLSLSDPAASHLGDEEPIDQIISASRVCITPFEMQCRTMLTHKDHVEAGQTVRCDLTHGLLCLNQEQSSHQCYNYEVRIKCWTCGGTTTPTPFPLELCPEVPETTKDNCPVSCPYDYACDGTKCVPHIDCPCLKDGKRFEASNIIVTADCQRCECILGGHSHCKPIECPACLPGQKSEMDNHCNCECTGCPEETILCPKSGECVREDKWCDGTVDCPDDEADCPTTLRVTTTTTPAPTTTELPVICSNEYTPDADTCEMTSNLFDTFDGLTYQYDICDHALMKEATSQFYSVTVHRTCSSDNPNDCQRYLIIEVDDVIIKMGPGMEDVTVQDNRVSISNLWLVSRRFQDFELKKRGNSLIFRSKKYYFDVMYNSIQDVKITVSSCLVGHVVGLCGLYNKQIADDRTAPDGNLVTGNEDFGDSWSIGPIERCTPTKCPLDVMKIAIDICKELKEEPFNTSCTEYVKLENRVEACITFMCECMQRTVDARLSKAQDVLYDFYDQNSCKCLAYDSFVEACETARGSFVPEWQIKYDCTPECPPGMEWQDCGPGCELTCDNYHERDVICSTTCNPGCYCPPGLIRHHNRCVKPKMCQDCVCRGHGDPNYITFDGQYYAFQGNCTYVLAQHLTSQDDVLNFKILVTNVECPEEPHTSCADGLKILWNFRTIEKFRNKPVYLNYVALEPEESPVERDGVSITYVPGKSTVIHIPEINLVVRYFDQMYGFNVELPAFFYFNKTEGLCGVCNFIQSDDLYHKDGFVTENVEDFAYSWLDEQETREHCEMPRIVAPEPPPEICNFTISPCEIFLDPSLYSQACQNDVTYSQKPMASMCRAKFQYAQQCCERGVSLVEWLELSGCENSCPEGMHFECTSACVKTCDNYKNYKEDDCDLMPLYTCTCPENQVMKLGRCVDTVRCEVCDALGHVVGDVWNMGPCTQCECMEDLSTRCTVTECNLPPICKEKETLEKMTRHVNACCDAYQCKEIAELTCPEEKLPDCPPGEAHVIGHKDGCPVYHCECMPSLCPPLVEPPIEEGEANVIETVGCCPQYRTVCYPEKCNPTPLCGTGFKLNTFEGRCCTRYSCVPKKDVCVYQFMHDVVNGTQVDLPAEEYYEMEFEPGSSWQDGLCQHCSCIAFEGIYSYVCREDVCPSPAEFPDAEKYVIEEIVIPGACCPKYRRAACLVNGITYKIDEDWPSPDGDKCLSYKCIEDQKGEATVQEKRTICIKTCPQYAVYEEATADSDKCCGSCKPFACEENGILYQDGATWMSSFKPCYTAACTVTENGTRITYEGEHCPPLPDNCPVENLVKDRKGCCTYCKLPTDTCAAVEVPQYQTRGFFGYVDKVKGFCSNEQSLEGLTKCAGMCSTESDYSNLIGDFQSVCNCCLPLKAKSRTIVLECEDGSTMEKEYHQPISCRCSSCSGSDRSLESMNQIEPY